MRFKRLEGRQVWRSKEGYSISKRGDELEVYFAKTPIIGRGWHRDSLGQFKASTEAVAACEQHLEVEL